VDPRNLNLLSKEDFLMTPRSFNILHRAAVQWLPEVRRLPQRAFPAKVLPLSNLKVVLTVLLAPDSLLLEDSIVRREEVVILVRLQHPPLKMPVVDLT
jgi:hypothetical protein